jgi:hypothetical protein
MSGAPSLCRRVSQSALGLSELGATRAEPKVSARLIDDESVPLTSGNDDCVTRAQRHLGDWFILVVNLQPHSARNQVQKFVGVEVPLPWLIRGPFKEALTTVDTLETGIPHERSFAHQNSRKRVVQLRELDWAFRPKVDVLLAGPDGFRLAHNDRSYAPAQHSHTPHREYFKTPTASCGRGMPPAAGSGRRMTDSATSPPCAATRGGRKYSALCVLQGVPGLGSARRGRRPAEGDDGLRCVDACFHGPADVSACQPSLHVPLHRAMTASEERVVLNRGAFLG